MDSTFNNQLKLSAQWEKWHEELKTTLSQIIGCRRVPLLYVICEDETPFFDAAVAYEYAINQAMTLTGVDYVQDTRTVHKIILKNIHKDSDAYTYVKMLLRHRNGQRDISALRERYASNASKQAIINRAKQRLTTLRYVCNV